MKTHVVTETTRVRQRTMRVLTIILLTRLLGAAAAGDPIYLKPEFTPWLGIAGFMRFEVQIDGAAWQLQVSKDILTLENGSNTKFQFNLWTCGNISRNNHGTGSITISQTGGIFNKGDSVMIQGLKNGTQYNGCPGTLVRWIEHEKRWRTEINGTVIDIDLKPENLSQAVTFVTTQDTNTLIEAYNTIRTRKAQILDPTSVDSYFEAGEDFPGGKCCLSKNPFDPFLKTSVGILTFLLWRDDISIGEPNIVGTTHVLEVKAGGIAYYVTNGEVLHVPLPGIEIIRETVRQREQSVGKKLQLIGQLEDTETRLRETQATTATQLTLIEQQGVELAAKQTENDGLKSQLEEKNTELVTATDDIAELKSELKDLKKTYDQELKAKRDDNTELQKKNTKFVSDNERIMKYWVNSVIAVLFLVSSIGMFFLIYWFFKEISPSEKPAAKPERRREPAHPRPRPRPAQPRPRPMRPNNRRELARPKNDRPEPVRPNKAPIHRREPARQIRRQPKKANADRQREYREDRNLEVNPHRSGRRS